MGQRARELILRVAMPGATNIVAKHTHQLTRFPTRIVVIDVRRAGERR
ncbi:MAG TPA: hypothetical protein VGN11_05205 [Candidatus Baltobacteraceae bacterium]|nr:hypothetical protein [Candidatus Baltobacteraceae bacterium]